MGTRPAGTRGIRRRAAQVAAVLVVVPSVLLTMAGPAAAATAVSGVGLSMSSRAADASGVTWIVSFKVTTALAASTSQIVVTGGSGVVFSSVNCDYAVTDLTTGSTATCPTVSAPPGSTSTTVTTPFGIPAAHVVALKLFGTKNGPLGSSTGTVHTSTDPNPVSLGNTFQTASAPLNPQLVRTTTAVGARAVTWSLRFVTSPAGALARNHGAIVVSGAAGTVFSTGTCDVHVQDLDAGTLAGCAAATATGTTIRVTPPSDIPANHFVLVTMANTINPTSGTPIQTLSTTSDNRNTLGFGDPATSALSASAVTLSVTPKVAGASQATWSAQLTLSSTGALVGSRGQIQISSPIVIPGGTVFSPAAIDYKVTDLTTGGSAAPPVVSPTTATVKVTVPFDIPAGHQVGVSAAGTTNPTAAGPFSAVSVSTTSDTVVAHPASGSFVAAGVSTVTLAANTAAAGAQGALWTVRVTTSANGALVGGHGKISITAPTGTLWPTNACAYTFRDVTTGSSSTCFTPAITGLTASSTAPFDVPGGHQVSLTASGVTNPGVGPFSAMNVVTSSDPTVAHPSSGDFVAAVAPTAVTLFRSTTAGDAQGVKWLVRFATSSHGGLAAGTGQLVLGLPAGTSIPVSPCSVDLVDVTTGVGVNCLSGTTVGATFRVTAPQDIPAGHLVTATIHFVTNPHAGADASALSVSTTSDTVVAHPASSLFTTAAAPANLAFDPTTTQMSATNATWVFRFSTSPTGALEATNGTVNISAGNATLPGGSCDYQISDVTAGRTSCATKQGSSSNATVAVPFDIPAAHVVAVTISGVAGPKAADPFSALSVTTTSDLAPAHPTSGSFTADQHVTEAAVLTSTHAAQASHVTWSARFTTSATGFLVKNRGRIHILLPGGTAPPAPPGVGCAYQVTDLTTGASAKCPGTTVFGTTVDVTVPFDIPGSHSVVVTITDVRNPTAGSPNVALSTTSDTLLSNPSAGTFTAAVQPTLSFFSPTSAVGGGNADWLMELRASTTGTLVSGRGEVIVTAPVGTHFPTGPFAYYAENLSSGVSANFVAATVSGTTARVVLPFPVESTDHVFLKISGVINPAAGVAFSTIGFSTSSDTVLAHPSGTAKFT